jgi:hypothetical protein
VIPPDVHAWLANTHGLIEVVEGEHLAMLAAKVPASEAIVEIGTHTGLSTCWMAAGATRGGGAHIFAIDPWPAPRPPSPHYNDDPWGLGPEGVLERFRSNVAGTTQEVPGEDYRAAITAIRATSQEMASRWLKPIGLLFIDAIHTYDEVFADYRAWSPHVAPGGWIALNDYWDDPDRTWPGDTARVIDDVIVPSGNWGEGEVVWNTWVARRS